MAEITLTVPDSAEGLQDLLNDEAKVRALMLNPDGMKEMATKYAQQIAANDPDLAKQGKEAIEAGFKSFQEQLEDNGYTGNLKRPPMGANTPNQMGKNGGHDLPWFRGTTSLTAAQQLHALAIYEPESPVAHLDGIFERMANFYQSVAAGTDPYWFGQGLKGVTDARMKALNESQGDQGGFLVPEEFRVQLLSLALEASIMRPRSMVIPMTTMSLRIPTIRDSSHATTVWGGIQAYWVPESGSLTASEPTFSQVQLDAKKLTGLTRVTNEQLRDSAIAMEALLNRLFGQAIAYFEDDAFINGVGGGQPIGILNADALISISKETAQASTTIVWENLIKAYARMLPASLGNAIWIAHPDVFPQLATMALSVGVGGSAVWLSQGAAGPPSTILGRPVFFSEKCQTLGTAGDIYFIDPSYYLIGDRMSLEVASSMHTRFTSDETEFRFIERLDGKPWLDTALTPRNGSNTFSPFINLAVRS